MGYFISRQRDFKDNCLYVEIAVGKAHAGPDILTTRYNSEQKNLVDPRDAVRIAEEIYRRWDRDYGDEKKRLRIVGLPQPLVYEFSTMGIAAAKTWADRIYYSMEKCGACSKPMGNRAPYEHDDLANLVFCTELCCSRKYRDAYGIEPKQILPGSKRKMILKK